MGSETEELGECWKHEGDVTEQLWRQQIRCERLFTFQTIELNSFQTDYKLIFFKIIICLSIKTVIYIQSLFKIEI